MRSIILINCKENYNGCNPIKKEGRIFESPLCLKLGSSCGDGDTFCSPLTSQMTSFSWIILSKITPLG